MNRPKLTIDTLIFSLNDVIIDVSYSYQAVVRKTVQLYLESMGLTPSKQPLLTADEITCLQRIGHFTDYWDLTIAFIIYFIELLPRVPSPTFPIKFHVPAMMAYLQVASAHVKMSIDELCNQKNIEKLARDTAAAGGGVNGTSRCLPSYNRHLLVASGPITKINLVGRIFQELYLGADLFERTYHQPTVIVQSSGYSELESLLLDRAILEKLSQKLPVGLISERPKFEVERSLNARQITQFFQRVVTLDDLEKSNAKKLPDPWLLLEVVRQMNPTATQVGYIGSNPAEIEAARAASKTIPFTPIACLVGAHDKEMVQEELEKSNPSMILGHPNHLKELILG